MKGCLAKIFFKTKKQNLPVSKGFKQQKSPSGFARFLFRRWKKNVIQN